MVDPLSPEKLLTLTGGLLEGVETSTGAALEAVAPELLPLPLTVADPEGVVVPADTGSEVTVGSSTTGGPHSFLPGRTIMVWGHKYTAETGGANSIKPINRLPVGSVERMISCRRVMINSNNKLAAAICQK